MRWGPQWQPDGTVLFSLWAPGGETLEIEIVGRERLPMTPTGEGWFQRSLTVDAGAAYRFVLPDGRAVPDPAARCQEGDVHGPSILPGPAAYPWRHADWIGRPWRETVIYEVHPGLMGGFEGIARALPRLAALGITAIELMPIAHFAGERGWGYDGVLPYAPAPAYGTPDALRAMIDTAHGLDMMVFLDVVYNHFGPEGNYLPAYAPDFVHPEIHTPWGAGLAFEREPVRRFFIDNALMWLEDYRFDGLRFDAVHAIADAAFLGAMAGEIRATVAPERHIHLMLENEGNDASLLAGAYTSQWNDDFHNAMHVLLTGETESYYADFAHETTEKLARCLMDGFVYQGEPTRRHGTQRGTPSGHLPSTAFIAFLQNHDQIGNRAMGERLTLLTAPDRLRAATVLLLLSPQIPLLFMGDEVGAHSPFLFFTDFHDALAEAVREGRRNEFGDWPAYADPQSRAAIPDPNAQATFDASRVVPGPDADDWLALHGDLLAIRRDHIVPRLDGATGTDAQVLGEGAVLARWYMGDGAVLTLLVNLGAAPVAAPRPAVEPLFSCGAPGRPGSCVAWLEV